MKSLSFIVIFILLLFFGWLAKDGLLSHYLFRKMGFDITASNIWITPSRLVMDQFRIKNPEEYKLRNAFSAKKVSAEFTFDGIKENPSYIDLIVLDDVIITIECFDKNCAENNWKHLSKNKSTHERNFIIDRLVFQNLTIEVLNDQGGQTPKKIKAIPYLALTQVSADEGFPIQTIIQQVFESAELQRYSGGFPAAARRETRQARRRGYY